MTLKSFLSCLFLSAISFGLHAETHATDSLPGGGTGDPIQVKQNERDALAQVVLRTFTMNPLSVAPFGTTTANWNVTIPPNLPFEIVIKLNGQIVPPIGSQSFQLIQPTQFNLTAVIADDPTVGRLLRGWLVRINTSTCNNIEYPSSVLTEPLKEEFDALFSGINRITLKPGGTNVTAGENIVTIDVPFTIDVPDWFDGDGNINIQLEVTGATKIFVGNVAVNTDVHWSLLSDILSGGGSSWAGTALSQVSNVYLTEIVNAQLVPVIQQNLTNLVNSYTANLQANDPAHRTFVQTSLLYTARYGLQITACPQ
jgi:hypothetical protein